MFFGHLFENGCFPEKYKKKTLQNVDKVTVAIIACELNSAPKLKFNFNQCKDAWLCS